jgi:hypothetical protein
VAEHESVTADRQKEGDVIHHEENKTNSASGSESRSSYASEESGVIDKEGRDNDATTELPEIPHFNENSQSNAFWTRSADFVRNIRSQRLLTPTYGTQADDAGAVRRKSSAPSALSSDMGSAYDSPYNVTPNNELDESETLRCSRCRGRNFRATKTKGGRQKLVCVRCNTALG